MATPHAMLTDHPRPVHPAYAPATFTTTGQGYTAAVGILLSARDASTDLFDAYCHAERQVAPYQAKRLGDVFRDLWGARMGVPYHRLVHAARASGEPIRPTARKLQALWASYRAGGSSLKAAREAIRDYWRREHDPEDDEGAHDEALALLTPTENLGALRLAESAYLGGYSRN